MNGEEIMDMMGLKDQYIIKPPPLDEKAIQDELTDREHALPPPQYAMILAEHKAKAVGDSLLLKNDTLRSNTDRKGMEYYVIGSDTIVEIDGTILEKPTDENDARNMLTRLSGRWHSVHTGVSIYSSTNNYETPITSFTETSQVKFTHLTAADIEAYIKTQEPMDKAGSYGIQGIGGQMVESIQGDFFAVMGLPMHKLSRELAKIIVNFLN
jgi:septum formation protein